MRRSIAVCAVLLVACKAESNRLAVRCGELIDGVSPNAIADVVVVIEDGRISAVGRQAPAGVPLIDLSGFTVLPGLVDLHVHLADSPKYSGDLALVVQQSEADALADARANAAATLHAGFTSVRDLGSYRAWVVRDLRDAIRRGELVGPRIQAAGPYLTVPGGGGELNLPRKPNEQLPAIFRVGVSRGVDQFARNAKAVVDGGANVLKVIASGAVLAFNGIPGEPEMTEAEIAAVARVAHQAGLRLAAHAHGARSIREAIRAGADTIEHATYLDAEGITAARERGVTFSMDVYDGDYIELEGRRRGWPEEFLRKNLETMNTQRAAFKKALEAGAKLGFGTDAAVFPHGENAKQFAVMVRLGMTPMQAIQSATVVAAEAMGWGDQIGAVVPGRKADLIAVRGSPLEDITRLEKVEFVMLEGRVTRDAATVAATGR